jgi:predicted peptidase
MDRPMTRARFTLAVAMVVVLGCAQPGSSGSRPSSRLPGQSAPPPATESPGAQPTVPPGVALRPYGTVPGADLGFAEYLPNGYGDSTPRPLLVFLHGSGEAGDGSEAALPRIFKLGIPALLGTQAWGADRPFVVLMPQYSEATANEDCALADELAAFLAFAVEHYDVDPTHLYLTAVSCGAIGSWDYLGRNADPVVAAAVLIAGHLEDAWPNAGCNLGRVPTWVFHGEQDEIVSVRYVEDAVARLQACTDPAPVEVKLTLYPDADHDSWTRTYDLSAGHDIYAWLLDHARE